MKPNQKQITVSEILNFNITDQQIDIQTKEAKLRLLVFSDNVIQVKAVLKEYDFETFSYSVVGTPQKVDFTFEELEDVFWLRTSALQIKIQKKPFRLSFWSKEGILLNEDDRGFGISWIGSEVSNYKTLQTDERFIGLGAKTGNLDKRGNSYVNWNVDAFGYGEWSDPLYCTTPFYMGIVNEKMYGIFLDNTYQTRFNFGASSDRFAYFQASDGELNYYFIHQSTIGEILKDYTYLTGRIEMPPLWSLGYQQCRYSYYPDQEILSLADTFRYKEIPADVLYLDIHYMEKYKVFTWDTERFSNPKEFIQQLAEKGFHVVLIFDPGVKVEKGYHAYESGLEADVFAKYPDGENYTGQVWPGWCHFPDFTNPKTREWWGKQFESLTEMSIEGFWNDMNEPAVWGKHFPDMVEFEYEGEKSDHKKAHNVYGMQMARATFENTKQLLKNKRPFVLTRAGFSGVQRYSAVWTGDNVSELGNMLSDVRIVSGMGLAGLAFAGYDVGGFVGEVSTALFNRWIALGAFAPFFRGHTMINSKDAEPWSFGEETEDIARNYIRLRYRLLPYLYATFYEATQSGMPIQRSLAIEYPLDSKIYEWHIQNQYLFGANILVCPITDVHPIHKVYLPKGDWYDLMNDKHYQGNQEVFIETPKDKLPLFARGGGMILMQSLIQHTQQRPTEVLELHLYRGEVGSEFVYYEDDGVSYNFEQGAYYKRSLHYQPEQNKIRLTAKEGNYPSHFRQLKVYLHGFEQADLPQEDYRFLEPISHFDPWEYKEDIGKVIRGLSYLLVEWKDEAFEIVI